MNSCIYEGRVTHRRNSPVAHAFGYRIFMSYVDLDESEELFAGRWLWSDRRPAPLWFRRADYLGPRELPLDRAVRDYVEERGHRRPDGPIRVLTHFRSFGYVQNPVSFYYCFASGGERLEHVVAEITNTPWGERHRYLCSFDSAKPERIEFGKEFHVSPFMGMEQRYRWSFTAPGSSLGIRMSNHESEQEIFDATLDLERKEIRRFTPLVLLLRFPLLSFRVVAAIYWQALRLKLKGCPFHPHPDRERTRKATS